MMMKPFRSHGKHCYLRSFKTTCRKCGDEVLYWECTHGSKLFFNYPPYGKLIRHYCRRPPIKDPRKHYPITIKKPKGLLENASPSCPVCGRVFKYEYSLNEHINQLKKSDRDHISSFTQVDSLQKEKDEQIKVESESPQKYNKPTFGKINIKKRNQ